jgi:rhomboid family GlyGly-CTERM serine protease
MNLGRLSQLTQLAARAWRAPLVLALVLAAVQVSSAPVREALPYDRAAILTGGEYWRLVTAHFFHYDLTHLAWNLAGLALVAWLFAREFDLRGWIAILLAATVAVDLGFLVLEPQLEWYVGFSGVLHGLMAAGLCAWLWRKPDALTALVAVLFALKLAWEHSMGALPFTASTLTIAVIHEAHTYGAIGGVAAALGLLWRRRPALPSL